MTWIPSLLRHWLLCQARLCRLLQDHLLCCGLLCVVVRL
jgi:hypothetical protein